jgi:multisubunit Na+/H+ antiporter MnhF subunit
MSTILTRLDVAVIIGIVGAIGLVLVARVFAPHRELLVYGVGLGITAVAYVLFALHHGAPARLLGLELVGAALYGSAAVLGTRRWPALLAFGWTAHVAWDLFLHPASVPAYAPVWYPWFCVGFDLSVGGYIAGLVAATTDATARR